MSEQRSKRQKLVHNPFIDYEATADDDDDELILQTEDDFDEDEEILDSSEIHSRLGLRMEEDNQIGLWDSMIERAKLRSRFEGFNLNSPEEDVSEFLPKDGEGLWEIGCKIGHEDIAVYKVLQEAANTPVTLARSVLAHPGRPGRIYAEVDSIGDARRLATLVEELNVSALRRVPPEDLVLLLRVKKSAPLHPWAWVRVCDRRKRWAKYRGDVGVVRTRDPNDEDAKHFSNKRFIHLVPRLFFPSDEDQSFFPPPQRLLPDYLLMEKFGLEHVGQANEPSSGDPLTLSFKGEEYDPARGLLVVAAENINVVAEPGLLPSLTELRLINETGMIPRTVYTNTVEAIRRSQLAIGARVMVKYGDFKGLIGIIQDRKDEMECAVQFPSQDVVANILVRDLRAEFRCGDRLRVVNGLHKGLIGWVVDIDPITKNVSLVNAEDTRNLISVKLLAMDLVFHEDDFLRTGLRPQKPRSRLQKLGFRDWNNIYIGKNVVVINKGQWKGYEGIIKNTSADGLAWVELQATLISYNRTQVFKLEQLGIRQQDWKVIPGRNLNQNPSPADERLPIPIALTPQKSRSRSPTPIPTPGDRGLSPAWDPNSITPPLSPTLAPTSSACPLPENLNDPSSQLHSLVLESVPSNPQLEEQNLQSDPLSYTSRKPWHWLQDESFQGMRVQLRKEGSNLAVVEFVKMEGDSAVVRDGPKQVREHLDNLVPVRPAKINDCVILLSGDEKGKLFKVKEFRDDGHKVMELALPPPAAAAPTPGRLVSPILREFPMYTQIMEVLDQAPRDGDHGALVNAVLRYEKLLLSFVGSSAKIHDAQRLLGIQIQNAGGRAQVVATQVSAQASPENWTAKQALEVMDVITLYKVADALALAKGMAPFCVQFPPLVPLTKALPDAAKGVVDKLLDVGALVKAFKKGISKITSPSVDDIGVVPSVGLLKALHRLDDSKNIMKIQKNFLLVAAFIAYMQDCMQAPKESTSASSLRKVEDDGPEVPDVTFQQFDRRLDKSCSKEEVDYLGKLNKLGVVALRFPLQLALFLSPLVLLMTMALEKKTFDRNHLIRLARALGTDRPPSVIQIEKSLWNAVFALIKDPASGSKALEDLAVALPDDVSPEACQWFQERLRVFQLLPPPVAATQELPPPVAPARDKSGQVPATAVPQRGPLLPVPPEPVPPSTPSPRLRDLDQQAGEEAASYSNPPSPEGYPEGGEHGEADEASQSQQEKGGKGVEQEDRQEGGPQTKDVQPEAHEGQESEGQVQYEKEKEHAGVAQEDGQEQGLANEDVQVDESSQLENGGKGEDVNMDVDEEVNKPEANQKTDLELDDGESGGKQDLSMDVDEEPRSETDENRDLDQEEHDERPHSDPELEGSDEEPASEENQSDGPAEEESASEEDESKRSGSGKPPPRRSSRPKNPVPPQPSPPTLPTKPRAKPKPGKPKQPPPTPPTKPHPKPKPVKPKQPPPPAPSKQATSVRKLGRSSTREYDDAPEFDPEPAQRYEGNRMLLFAPDGTALAMTPKMNLPEDVECLESFYDAVVSNYVGGRPLHAQLKPSNQDQPEEPFESIVDARSCLARYTHESFSKATTRELLEVFRHKHIMVTGCPYEERHFDEEGVAYLEKRMNSIISAHDHSIPVEDGDYSVQEIKLTFAEFIGELHKPDGHILNGLNFPLSMRGARVTKLSTCVEAFTATKGRLHCPDEVPFPTADFNWALASHACTHHLQHMDTAGVNTLFEGNCGSKYVIVATRPLSAKNDPFASNSAFGEQFAVDEPVTGEWQYEAVLLRPGDMFFMRANTIHFVFTPENAIFHGSHFYATSTLRETLYALTHCLMGDVFLTNTSHPKGILLLLRILHFCHETFIVYEPDFDDLSPHLPDLRTMDGFMDLVHLCSIVLFFNVLDPRTYQLEPEPNSLSEERYFQYDRNGIPSEDRLSFAYARGLAQEVLEWIDATFILEAPPGSVCIREASLGSVEDSDSTEDGFLGCREFFAREALHHGLYIINYRRKVQAEDQERRRLAAEAKGEFWVGTGHEHPEQLLAVPKMTCANVMQQVAWALLTLHEITPKRWEQATDEIEEVHYMVADQERVKYTPIFREVAEELDGSWKPWSAETRYAVGKTQGDRKYFVGQAREFNVELDHGQSSVGQDRVAEALRQFKKRYAFFEPEVPSTKRRRTRR